MELRAPASPVFQEPLMSTMLCRGLVCAVVAAAVATSAAAQAPKNDLLERRLLENKIAAQKLEQEVNDAIAESRRVAAKEPTRAVAALKLALAKLEKDDLLTQDRRETLIKTLKARIRLYENDVDAPVAKAGGDMRRAEEEARARDDRDIQKTLIYIAQLKKDGRTVEAARMADELARRYPSNPAANAGRTTAGRADAIAANNEVRGDSGIRFNGAMVAIDKAKVPPAGDLDMPTGKDLERLLNRKGLNEPLLSKKETEIVKSLAKPISVDYDKIGFTDVIQDLSDKLGCNIIVDKAALNDALVTSETAISIKLSKVSSRTVLRKVLADLGLAYIIKNDVIQVISAEKARETMVTRTYYIGGLLAGGPFADAGIRFVPGLDQLQAAQNVVNLIGLIQATVDPDSWEVNGKGGKGTVTFYGPLMALTIRNTAEVHGMMGGYVK